MKKNWSRLSAVDRTYFRNAEFVYSYAIDIPSDADSVWREIASPEPLTWVRALDAHYTTPVGMDARREVSVLKGLLKLDEHFFFWDDELRRHSFYAVAANVPVFKSFAEDYQVNDTGEGRCQFVWTFAFDAKPGLSAILGAGAPMNRKLFNSMIEDTKRHFG